MRLIEVFFFINTFSATNNECILQQVQKRVAYFLYFKSYINKHS